MKKNLLSTLICLIISIDAFSQNAYYDALFCASLNEVDADTNSYASFSFNGGDKKVLSEFKLFLKDPFKEKKPNFERVKGIFQKIKASEQISDRANGLAGLEIVSLLAPIFNLSKMSSGQTDTLLYGLTIYLADEFRKGYMQTYMNTVKKTIGKSGELQVLFPTTYQKILTFDPIRYKDFGNEMKGVYDEDLGNTLDNLIKHIDNEEPDSMLNYLLLNKSYCKKLRDSPNYPYLSLTATMGQKLINGVHPSDILGHLDEKYYSSSISNEKEIGKTLHLLNILQRNLRDTSTRQNNQFSNVWLNFEKLSKLNNPKASKYFLALIQKEDITFFNSSLQNFKQNIIFKIPASEDNYKDQCDSLKLNYITPILSILTKLDELTKLKEKSLLEEKNFQMYLNNVGEFIDLVATNFNPKKKKDVRKIINLTSNVFQIYNAVRVKNYSNLPVYLSSIITNLSLGVYAFDSLIKVQTNLLTSKNQQLKNVELCKKDREILTKQTTKIKFEIDSLSFNQPINNLIAKVDNLSSFSAGIVSAKTSQDINKVIKNYVSSPTTFIEKREKGFNINIGAMPGIKYDFENTTLLKKDKTDSITVTGQNIGLSLPVGIDFTLPAPTCLKGFSVGLFVQAIDLGAMLNYRLTSNANILPDTVGFKSVLSPGVSLSVGLPNTPLTFQFGYHWGPVLRNITDGKTVLASNTTTGSIHIRIAYDIPLFRIKGRKNVQD